MRAKGNFRLILNASMFKGQKFAKMEGGKGVTFPCVNAASENEKDDHICFKNESRTKLCCAASRCVSRGNRIALLIAGGEESKKED